MADEKISELPVATAIASPDVAPIVQGGVTKQADIGLFAGLSGSVTDQQVAFGNGTTIAGSDDFKWDYDDSSLVFSRNGTPAGDNAGIDIRVPKNFVIGARNNADDDNFSILEKRVTSGHDNLILGTQGHGQIELNGVGNQLSIIPDGGLANGTVIITAQTIALTTDKDNGYNTQINGDLEIGAKGWLLLIPQHRTDITGRGFGPFEGVIYEDIDDHHFWGYNGTAFVQLDNDSNPIFPDSDPHIAGAGYWVAGVLTRSNG